MSISLVQSVPCNFTGSPYTAWTQAFTPTAGHYVTCRIVGNYGGGQRVLSIVQTNVPWQRISLYVDPGDARSYEVWAAVVGASPGGTVVINQEVALGTSITIPLLDEWSCTGAGLVLDVPVTATTASASTTATTPSITPTTGESVVLLAAWFATGAIAVSSPTNSFTLQTAPTVFGTAGFAYRIVSSASGSYSTAATLASSNTYEAGLFALREVATLPAARYLSDAFSGPDGTNLSAHTMNAGGNWTLTQNTGAATAAWDIQANKARSASGGVAALAVAYSGACDCAVRVTIAVPATGAWSAGLVFRYQNPDNYWHARLQKDATGTHLYIVRTAAGTATTESTTTLSTLTGSVQLSVRLYGPSIAVHINDVLTAELTHIFRQTATKHGLFAKLGVDGADTFGSVLYNNFGTSQLSLVVCDGDSLTLGLTAPANYPYLMRSVLGANWVTVNLGIGSQQTNTMTANAFYFVDRLFDPNVFLNLVSVIWGGTNDLYANISAATVLSNLTTYTTARRAVGWKAIVVSMIPLGAFPGGTIDTPQYATYEARRQTLATGERAMVGVSADGIADVAANTVIGQAGDENNSTYFNADLVHLKQPGYEIVAGLVGAVILGLYLRTAGQWRPAHLGAVARRAQNSYPHFTRETIMSSLAPDATLYRNNDWNPRAIITKINETQDDVEPYTAADVTAYDLKLFLAGTEDTDVQLGDDDAPEYFEVFATPLDGTAEDGEYLLSLEAENVTTENLTLFPAGIAYLHIRVANGSREVIQVPVEMIKRGVIG